MSCVSGLIYGPLGELASSEHPNRIPDLGIVSRHEDSKEFFSLLLQTPYCMQLLLKPSSRCKVVITEDQDFILIFFFFNGKK